MSPRRSILLGCECSGALRREFEALGWDAWSCDLKPAEDGSPKHIQGDVFAAIATGCPTDGQPWSAGFFHPPCDYLTVSGNRWFSDSVTAEPGTLTGAARRAARADAVEFVKRLWGCSIPRVGIENPIGRLSTLWRKPTQTIQPTMFGAPFRKATCLWLRGFPALVPTHVPGGDLMRPAEPVGEQACWKMGPSATRKADRARTYPEVAKAIAQQFTASVNQESSETTRAN